MKLKYSRTSSFLKPLEDWLDENASSIDAYVQIALFVPPAPGFVRHSATVEIIRHEDSEFEPDWRYAPHIFPSRLRALATALNGRQMYGRFRVSHQAGDISIQKVKSDKGE